MGIAEILLFLKNNWKWIAVGVFILSLASYIEVIRVERDHYKSKSESVQLKLDTLVKTSNDKEAQLNADVNAITAKYKSTLADANTLVTATAKLNGENIAKDKELASVKLSLNAVRLFNASKQSSTEGNQPAKAESGNDGSTTSVAKALEEKSQSLADLLQVVNVNDANHLKCIAAVNEWQRFWADFAASVESVNNAGSN